MECTRQVQLEKKMVKKTLAAGDQGLDPSGGFLSFTVGPCFFKLTPGPARKCGDILALYRQQSVVYIHPNSCE